MPAHEISRTETVTINTSNGKSTTSVKMVVRLAVTGEDDVDQPQSSRQGRKFQPENVVVTVTDDASIWFDGVTLSGTFRKKDGSVGTMATRRVWYGFDNGPVDPMPAWLFETVTSVLDSIPWYNTAK